MGYSVNDSILIDIKDLRDNHVLLHKKIGKEVEVNFISEATDSTDNIVVYSEPLFLNSQMLSIAMSVKSNKDGYSNDFIFF
ncbi:MAG TPA: hypothetical protein DCG69_11980, partial [Bacteroidales bacterium]|nr:hypothetical protein [Bacteroidales bacterium]